MKTTEQLWRLQELEEQLTEAKKQKKILSDGKEIQENIQEHKNLKKQYENIKISIDETQIDIKRLEQLLEQMNVKKEENRGNLYGGKINDLKQLGIMLKDQEKMESEVAETEGNLIKAIELLESYEKNGEEIYSNERKLGGQIKKMLSDRQKNIESIEKKIEELTSQLAELKTQISKKDMDLYEYIKARKNRPVAQLNEDICTGCNMDLPVMTLTLLRKGEVATCDNCGRILHKGE
ncbi:hypothetical protein HNQ80_004030 [Anaerosolibacter carboniphilus]|uniref:C4-type zinc ribbon domain-containing protein n=1 Tax=Anaerosolibacter carboniphilus TaxID=1417629 RepID=A0A841KW84_9FIRM|nr:C4-type zinc ribbon domain-containing protein [Anaerosolibacter carboniphilus]MBB6217894.1 hypothetical protein [Anaerosolibacter carboniphilus]